MAQKKKFRVRGHIKSFRDLEIYNSTTLLSSKIYQIELPSNIKSKKQIEKQLQHLEELSQSIPKLIAESYGDKFTDRQMAYDKLEQCARNTSVLITKVDFIIAMTTNEEVKSTLLRLIKKYQIQRRKILNLKRAWIKIAKKFGK